MTEDAERVIVIGSGPSGAMAALTLVEQGLPVTLLESGRDVPDGFLVRAMGRNIYRRRPPPADTNHDASAAWVQSLVPGGLSNYWVGAAPRFSPDDFSEGERLHERKVARSAASVGQGLAPMPLADGPNWMVTHTGVGFNSYTHVVRPLQRRPNFDLRERTTRW